MTDSEGSASPQRVSIPDPGRLNKRGRGILADVGPERYRILLVGGGTARQPEVLKEAAIHASDVHEAIRLAFRIKWPPAAIGLIVIDDEGRHVFGRDNPNRIHPQG